MSECARETVNACVSVWVCLCVSVCVCVCVCGHVKEWVSVCE